MPNWWQIIRQRSRYYIPILRWWQAYNWRQGFLSDFSAGVTVALLLIPQSLSYASGLAKLEPIVGLYTSFIPLLLYGILGTCRQISVGPEALVSLLIGNAVITPVIVGGNPDLAHSVVPPSMEDRLAQATLLSLMVGIITLALGLARFGFLDSVLSRALLRGFITAVSCVILIEQMPSLLGITVTDENHTDSPFHKLQVVLGNLGSTNWVTAGISAASVGFLFGFARLKQSIHSQIDRLSQNAVDQQGPFYRTLPVNEDEIDDATGSEPLINDVDDNDPDDPMFIPPSAATLRKSSISDLGLTFNQSDIPTVNASPVEVSPRKITYMRVLFHIPEILIVVMFTVFLSWALQLNENHSVAILGDAALKRGFMAPKAPKIKLANMKALVTPAILISILGFVESIVVAKYFGSKHNYSVSANRELVAFGALNLLGSMFNCFPAFASIARSRVNDTAGAKTQLAGIVTGFAIFFTVLFLLPIFYYLPKAVMASIVLVAASGLLEFHDILFMLQIRAWKDLFMSALTFVITIFWSVEAGTLISIALSLITVVKHSTAPKISILGKVAEFDHVENQTKFKYKPLQEIFKNPAEHQHKQLDDHDILIVKIEEALYFGNTGQLKDRLRRAEAYGGWLHIHPSEEERRRPADQPVFEATDPANVKRERTRTPNDSPDGRSSTSGAIPLPRVTPPTSSQQQNEFPSETSALLQTNSQLSLRQSLFQPPPALCAVIFDIENMPTIDASAIQILIEIVQEYQRRDIQVYFVKIREANKVIFLRSGLLGDILGSDHYFRKISDAVTAFRSTVSRIEPETSVSKNGYSTYNVL